MVMGLMDICVFMLHVLYICVSPPQMVMGLMDICVFMLHVLYICVQTYKRGSEVVTTNVLYTEIL
jgi:hypothetical protein